MAERLMVGIVFAALLVWAVSLWVRGYRSEAAEREAAERRDNVVGFGR